MGLLDAEVVDADDYAKGQDPASFISRSISRLWVPDGLRSFGLTYAFATVYDQLYFLVTLGEGHYLGFAPAMALCDRTHEQLGPSLLTHLYAHTPLTPAFTPGICFEYIVTSHWAGYEDAEELLTMARNDLAYAQGVPEESLSVEEVEVYADSHYFTPRRVDSSIDPRYQRPGKLSLETCLERCRREGFANLTAACELLMALRALCERLPERATSIDEQLDGYEPYAVLVGVQGENSEDLVEETYREHEQLVWQGGEFSPIYALEVDPDDPRCLGKLRDALEVGKESLELTQKLYDALEVCSCLFP